MNGDSPARRLSASDQSVIPDITTTVNTLRTMNKRIASQKDGSFETIYALSTTTDVVYPDGTGAKPIAERYLRLSTIPPPGIDVDPATDRFDSIQEESIDPPKFSPPDDLPMTENNDGSLHGPNTRLTGRAIEAGSNETRTEQDNSSYDLGEADYLPALELWSTMIHMSRGANSTSCQTIHSSCSQNPNFTVRAMMSPVSLRVSAQALRQAPLFKTPHLSSRTILRSGKRQV